MCRQVGVESFYELTPTGDFNSVRYKKCGYMGRIRIYLMLNNNASQALRF